MSRVSVEMLIHAPPDRVWFLFTDLENLADHIAGIEKSELLTEGPFAVGTRWRETRIFMKKEATEEMEVTEVDEGKRYRVDAESHGSHYTSIYQFEASGEGTRVAVTFEGRALSLLAKLLVPLTWMMMGTLRKLLIADMNDLKRIAEAG